MEFLHNFITSWQICLNILIHSYLFVCNESCFLIPDPWSLKYSVFDATRDHRFCVCFIRPKTTIPCEVIDDEHLRTSNNDHDCSLKSLVSFEDLLRFSTTVIVLEQCTVDHQQYCCTHIKRSDKKRKDLTNKNELRNPTLVSLFSFFNRMQQEDRRNSRKKIIGFIFRMMKVILWSSLLLFIRNASSSSLWLGNDEKGVIAFIPSSSSSASTLRRQAQQRQLNHNNNHLKEFSLSAKPKRFDDNVDGVVYVNDRVRSKRRQ